MVVRNQVLEPSASASWGVYEQGAAHGRNQGSDLGTVLWKAASQPAAYLLGQVHAPVCFFFPLFPRTDVSIRVCVYAYKF